MMQEMATARGGIMPVGPEAVAAIKAREGSWRAANIRGRRYRAAGQQGTNEIELLSSFGSLGTAQQFVARKQMELGVNPLGRQSAEYAMQGPRLVTRRRGPRRRSAMRSSRGTH
jgi:hypothetical protein